MPSGRSLFKKIQQLLDGPGALGSGDNAKVLAWNNATSRFVMTSLPAAVTPGGSTTQVQYNNGGAFAGDAGMTYDAANDALTLVGRLVVPVWRPASDSAAALKIKTAADVEFVNFNTTNRRVAITGGSANAYNNLFEVKDSNGKVVTSIGDNGVVTMTDSASTAFLVFEADAAVPRMFFGGTGINDFYMGRTGDTLSSNSFQLKRVSGTRMDAYVRGRISVGGTGAGPSLTALVHIQPSTATCAQINFDPASAADPTSPNSGDVWYNTWLKFRRGSTTEQIASGVQATGGAATAGGTYGATEQLMLQKIYDVGRAFGLLS